MENVNQIIKGVLDSFFDLDEQDERDKIVHLSTDDSKLVATAIEDALRSKGVIK